MVLLLLLITLVSDCKTSPWRGHLLCHEIVIMQNTKNTLSPTSILFELRTVFSH